MKITIRDQLLRCRQCRWIAGNPLLLQSFRLTARLELRRLQRRLADARRWRGVPA